jgi:hypothetical protein
LKKAAFSAEIKLAKFSEYLISKIEKRKEQVKAYIQKKLALELNSLLSHESYLSTSLEQTHSDLKNMLSLRINDQ